MSGKCRPSLRKKALYVVNQSDFSKAVKECIAEVFERYEKANAENEELEKVIQDLETYICQIEKGGGEMSVENCDKCKVGRWYYDMFGELLCEGRCPYTGSTKTDKKGENDD